MKNFWARCTLSLAFLLTIAGVAIGNNYYNHGGYPATGSAGSSAGLRAELDSITAGFDLLPSFTANANKAVIVNSGTTALTVTTGTLSLAGNFSTAGAFTTTGAFGTTLVQGATTTLTLPLVNGTLATLAGTETFTTKTFDLASNTLTGTTAQFNTALSDNDFATLAGSETLTTKTINLTSNTLTGTTAQFNTALSDNDFATLAGAESLSNKTIPSPVLSGTVTGTYVLGGTLSISLLDTKGDLLAATANDTPAKFAAGSNGAVLMARSQASVGLAYVAALNKAIYGFTYANNGNNDIDIAAGGAMDATGAYWLTGAALTKKADTAWAVGTAAGMLDTGTIGDTGYYIWAIGRSDTGVVDYLSSLSSTAPTMPTNYDFKRLIGWFNRTAGANNAFHTYETEGGGLELSWDVPTLDVNLATTLTTSRRTDAVKVPLQFSVLAHLSIYITDASNAWDVKISCPDVTDAAVVNQTATANMTGDAAGRALMYVRTIRTSATGTIAARHGGPGTIDRYQVTTEGFTWARRN